MKDYKKLIWALPVVTAMTGCTDFIDNTDYTVDKPENIAQYEYLNSYGTLKSYIDRGAHSGFLLGTGVSADDYLKRTGVFLLTNSNFDQVTTGNAMKYASIVNDKGEMDFGKVRDFVSAATEAGLEVYGHTLCWHEQQTVKWLNSLIKDKELEIDPNEKVEKEDYVMDYSTASSYNFWAPDDVKPNITINKAEGCFELVNESAIDNWKVQYHVADGLPIEKGKSYRLKVMARGTGEGTMEGKVGDWGGGSNVRVSFGTEWEEQVIDFTSATDGGFVLLQSGQFVGTIQIKYVKITHLETPAIAIPVPVWEPDFATVENKDDAIMGWGNNSTRKVVNNILEMTNPSAVNSWEAQAGKDFDKPFEVGTKYFLKLRIKGTKAGSISAGFQNPDGYKGCGDFNSISITTDWEDVLVSTTCTGDGAVRFLFSYGAYDGTIYIESLSLYYEKSANAIPLTTEEKAEVLTNEMERWVKGMMEATEGKVKAWDVVNEPLSGGGGWPYPMQSASTATDDTSNRFYWQDYLGDNYVRVPIKFARKYFAENGGNPADLKLFINDYNLESDWDDNGKVKSLVEWITRWESDGETVIDGIGTQMHVSYYMNPETQASKEEHIVKMFEILAASGKLIRITELDMVICDAKGKDILTKDVTFEQHQAMAEFYKFIVEKYFEIIPAAQQYGICAWAQTDSPEGSGWRPGQPIGLWNSNLERKPAYGGFCDGLAGK
ncbi:MAG: endo-1,4-beta-xylanase [Muribaculum sp.]